MSATLDVRDLSKAFGGLVVNDAISLRLEPGERVALIGPNGAGKTTFVNILAGLVAPSAGSIRLAGRDITTASPVHRVHAGMARTFQISRLWPDVSAGEHVELVLMRREGRAWSMFADPDGFADNAREARDLLARCGLAGCDGLAINEISYGQQRLLELAMALALRPKLLLLDEPAAGVSEGETDHILAAIAALPSDIAVLMIDHDMDLVFRFARRIVVMANGRVIGDGAPGEIAADPAVRAAYLGRDFRGGVA